MRKQGGSRLIFLAFLTTITIVAWVLVELYFSLNKRSFEKIPPEVLKEFNPNINIEILDQIEQKPFSTPLSQSQLEATSSAESRQ